MSMMRAISTFGGKLTASAALPEGPYRNSTLNLKGESLSATELTVTRRQFRFAGFNPRFLVPGLKLVLLSPNDYSTLCREMKIKRRELEGAYLATRRELEVAVLMGELEGLPTPRRIALPYDYQMTALRHELAHDILLSGVISPEARAGFFRLAMSEARRLLNFEPASPSAQFVRTIARMCQIPLDLTAIQRMCDFKVLDLDHRIFASELFAHSADRKLEDGKESSKAPLEIRNFFQAIRLFSRG